ncbi:hypothetical protein EJ05DRAFT_477708 [Pseudovirgaria hyperparasitica]|uniref:Protein kinase domain-containing protein n=1 Tax=Pseudovirgaria hyperparasitica TaxID=470096 RepID=A0A6A6W211_9PEZI|nr:uncharacterized protein EJ05DRAFT_477708 [Pseudovirgaria hyperparasitica]KAF2756593.1 hypothetical protein EJ05DRAFT_477708 [Pseudovirgaria hyperparasitica]
MSHYPYLPEETLPVQIDDHPSVSLDVTIIKAFEPFTLSCALLVRLNWPTLRGEYVLKLFDRRYATQLRRDNQASAWTADVEVAYHTLVESSDMASLFALYAQKETDYEWTPKAEAGWDSAHREAYLQFCCRKHFSTETLVYDQLRDLQGECIPHLAARILVKSPSSSGPTREYLDCPGILLEYVQGFSLTDLDKFAPKAAWQQICDEAIRIINLIGGRGIRNEDVKTRSFIVRHHPSTNYQQTTRPNVVMIDFGSCVLRTKDQDDRDWREWKAMQDEEGAIGMVMERKLNGGFTYVRTAESERLMDEFMSE